MGTPYEDQMQVLRWLQEREIEGGDPHRLRDRDVVSAFGWTEAKTKAVLRILKQRGDIEQDEFATTAADGYSVFSIRLTAQGHSRLDPPVSGQPALNLINNSGTMGPVQQGGSKNIQHAEVFQVAKEDKDFLEKASRFFLKLLGKWATILVGWLFTIAGSMGSLIAVASDEDSDYGLLFFPGIGLLILGTLMIRAYKQRKRSRCQACGTYYGLKETGATAQDVRLGSSLTQVERTTIRSYKCITCGKETTRTSTHIPN